MMHINVNPFQRTAGLSSHAALRLQQRGISRTLLDLLTEHGEAVRGGNAVIYYFNDKRRARVKHHVGDEVYKAVADRLNIYAVVSNDGEIITVGHHYRRMYRN